MQQHSGARQAWLNRGIAIGYAIVATTWIIGTDWIGQAVDASPWVQTATDLLFVAATAIGLALLLRAGFRTLLDEINQTQHALARLKVVSEVMTDGILYLDKDLRATAANRAARNLGDLGDIAPEDERLSFTDLVSRFAPTSDTRPLLDFFFHGGEVSPPVDVEIATGQAAGRVFQAVAARLPPAVGGYVLALRDVTEVRTYEHLLAESERQYRLLFEDNPVGMWVHDDRSLTMLAVNAAAARLLGRRIDEMLGQPLTTLLAAEEQDRTATAIRTSLNDRGRSWRFRTAAGGTFTAHLRAGPIAHEGRRATLVRIEDVTDLQEAFRRLRDRERLLRQAEVSLGMGAVTIAVRGDDMELVSRTRGMDALLRDAVGPDQDPHRVIELLRSIPAWEPTLLSALRRLATTDIVTPWPGHDGHLRHQFVPITLEESGRWLVNVMVIDVSSAERDRAQLVLYAEELKRLSRGLITLQEDERQRISRDLHDELGQLLTATHIAIDEARRSAAEGPARDRLGAALGHVRQALTSTRNLSAALHPPMLDDLGLAAALRSLVDQRLRLEGVTVTLDAEPDDAHLPAEIRLTAYRIAQEAITNALRHAGATRILVRSRRRDKRLDLIIADNGKGMTRDTRLRPPGSGLIGMRERALSVGGAMQIRSAPELGTALRVRLPFAEPDR